MNYFTITLTINRETMVFSVTEEDTLLDVIREKAGLTGTKQGCGCEQCGACTVLLNHKAVNSCCILALQADNGVIETIEGLESPEKLHPIQQAYIEEGAVQCGFCTPGMIMSTKALLDQVPNPDTSQIRSALSGNICRCTGYTKIEAAVKNAARKLEEVSNESI